MATDQEILDQQLEHAGFSTEEAPLLPTPNGGTIQLKNGRFEQPLAAGYDARQSKAVEDLLSTVNQRGSQYGTPADDKANLRGALLFNIDPILGALLRANDKWVRLQNLTRERDSEGLIVIKSKEHYLQIRDQMLDIAGYQIKAMEMLDEAAADSGWL